MATLRQRRMYASLDMGCEGRALVGTKGAGQRDGGGDGKAAPQSGWISHRWPRMLPIYSDSAISLEDSVCALGSTTPAPARALQRTYPSARWLVNLMTATSRSLTQASGRAIDASAIMQC